MTTYRQAERPAVLSVRADTIPDALRDTARWCVWRFDPQADVRTGELVWSKKPFQAHHIGRGADSTAPATWAGFVTAYNTYRRDRFDGLYFALGNGWAAVDLDDVVDLETNTIAALWEAEARAFDSYGQYSPSCRGLRVVLHAAES